MLTNEAGRPASRKNRGFALIPLLIAIVLTAIITIVALNAAQGQRAEAEMNQGVSFITTDVPGALTSLYMGNGRTFSGAIYAVPTGTTSNIAFNSRFGLDTDMPYFQNTAAVPAWEVTAVTPTTVTVQFTCSNLRSASDCSILTENVAAQNNAMIGYATATGNVTSSTTGCPAASTSCYVQVIYQTPR